MPQGYLSLILHAHLPFVKHPEYQEALEEHWLFEAISETYIPLLLVFRRLAEAGCAFKISMTLSPTLLEMLADPVLQERYVRHLEKLMGLAEKEVFRTKNDPVFHPLARRYEIHFNDCYAYFVNTCKRNLVAPFRQLQESGHLEILTCGATHAFFPLLGGAREGGVRAQVQVAVANYRKHFQRAPRGIWLPECGFFPGDDRQLKEAGLAFFIVDAHGLLYANPRPRYGVFAPCTTPAGVAVFGRDLASSKQVWSAKEGYPGDYDYREFYRDVGWDLEYEYIQPYLHESGIRKDIGIKYYRITGATDKKEPYDFDRAAEKAARHAEHFLFSREKQVTYLYDLFGGKAPLVVSPYDAELFGHWWYEGPMFLECLLRKIGESKRTLETITPSDYLERYPVRQNVEPELSSWGYKGYCEVWLNDTNDWIYRHLHHAAKRMSVAADDDPEPDPLKRRALNQMARELLLAQASDWAFIMKTGTVVDYAVRRTKTHLQNFLALEGQVRSERIDAQFLEELEKKDSLFPEIDYRIWGTRASAPKMETLLAKSGRACSTSGRRSIGER